MKNRTVKVADVVSVVSAVLAVIHAAFATSVFAGGASRMSSTSYEAFLALTNGHVWPHGMPWLVAAFLILAKPYALKAVGALVGIAGASLWFGLFVTGAVGSPTASFTALAAYSGYALIDAVYLGVVLVYRGDDKDA